MDKLDDDMLMAYADGELDEPTRAAVAAAIARDPALGNRVDRFKESAAAARAAFSPVLDSAPPRHLVESIDAMAPLSFGRHRRWHGITALMPVAAALLVTLGLGAGYWLGVARTPAPDTGLFSGEAGIVAALAGAVGGTAIPLERAGGEDQMIVTGSYPVPGGMCRSFVVEGPAARKDGVGCDRGEGYAVQLLMVTPPAQEFSLASGNGAVAAFLEAAGADVALTAAEEEGMFGPR